MKRREFIAGLGSAAAWPLVARAQQAEKVRRIGWLTAGSTTVIRPVFFDTFRGLGWIEGKNVAFEIRTAEDRPDRLPELVAELIHLDVDVIVTVGTLAPLAAKRATSTIPIVMAGAGDALGTELVASLARPGGNVTGMSMMVTEIAGKRLQMLQELLPRIAKVAVLWNAANPYPAHVFKETQDAGQTLGIEVQSWEVRGPDDLDPAFEAAIPRHPDALITVEDPLTVDYSKKIVESAEKYRLPAMYGVREFATVGGLMSYGVNIDDLSRRAAVYVDKILKGAKPADLPVEQPTKFDLTINLKTAKALGLTVPSLLLAQADEVIE
jgi:putative ABC transport system substrate-binding protein